MGNSRPIRAVIFDLYGTLCDFNQRAFFRELKNTLQSPSITFTTTGEAGAWQKILTTSYGDETHMLSDYCKALGFLQPATEQIDRCRTVLAKHQKLVFPRRGIKTMLTFLKHRGCKLGLLSNASQPFALAFRDLHFAHLFDHVAFSCEIGIAKPDPKAYRSVCNALGVSESDCLFVGDSIRSDWDVPRKIGMKTLCVKPTSKGSKPDLEDIGEIAWRSFSSSELAVLIPRQTTFVISGVTWRVDELLPLPEDSQGRYNIVAKAMATDSNGRIGAFVLKRYVSPISAYIENLAYKIMALAGLNGCPNTIIGDDEPMLIMKEVAGAPWTQADICEDTIKTIGSHCALAYIIGNADLRPRNTFINNVNGSTVVTVIDLEHCFFDRALVLPSHVNVNCPAAIDRLASTEIERFTKHRVLSRAATRRARKAFLPIDDPQEPLPRIFRDGWIETYRKVQANQYKLLELVTSRLYRLPPLIIGTHSYRRAMAKIDLQDMEMRIQQRPEMTFNEQY